MKMYYWVFVLFSLLAFSPNIYGNPSILEEFEKEFIKLVKQVEPSVVTVSATSEYSYPVLDESNREQDSPRKDFSKVEITNIASGVSFDPNHIITNTKVISGSKDITIITFDGKQAPATLVGTHDTLGIAVIEVRDIELTPATFRPSSELNSGCLVAIVGNSLGVSPAVSHGMLNCTRRDGMLQLSALVAAGNAGASVFDVHGNLVGILAAQFTSMDQDMSMSPNYFGNATVLAQPAERIFKAAQYVLENPNGFVGIAASNWPSQLGGVHVNRVLPGSPADQYGLEVGDIILSVDNIKLREEQELKNVIKSHRPGESVNFEILRGSGLHSVTVKLGQQPQMQSDYTPPSFGSMPNRR